MADICISVIITVYNIEDYISRCVDSVLKQTFKDIEILLIDDGSEDKSPEICEFYTNNYRFIKTFHMQNGGPSKARNCGIQNARGKYICFFDGDDFISPDYLACMYRNAIDHALDILIANYRLFPQMEMKEHCYIADKVMSGKELINSNNRIHTNNDLTACWRMLYRLDFLRQNSLTFHDKILYGEDMEFNIRSMVLAKRSMAIADAGYFYETCRDTSLMKTRKKIKYESSLVEQYYARKNHYGLHKQYDDDLYRYYIESLFWNMIKNGGMEPKEYIKKVLKFDMFRDAKKYFGLAYKTKSIRLYMEYLFMRFNCYTILAVLFSKYHKD